MGQRRGLSVARRYGGPVVVMSLLMCAVYARGALVSSGRTTQAVAASAGGGDELIRRHRCGACHLDLPQPDAPRELSSRSARAVFELLREPARHPDFKLSEGEAVAVALAVMPLTASELSTERRRFPRATAELGMTMVRGLRCGACHARLPTDDTPAPLLTRTVAGSEPGWLRGFLRAPHAIRPFGTRPGNGARMPAFGLSAPDADSIAASLRRRAMVDTAAGTMVVPLTSRGAAVADALLDRLSCRGCHLYRGRGGRVGPELDRVRERRTAAWIANIIRDPIATHPSALMPRLEDARLERVVALLAAGDPNPAGATALRPGYLSPLEYEPVSALGADARYALWCAACHGPGGRGDGYNAAFLETAPAVHAADSLMSIRPDDTLFDGIAAGGAALGRSPEMPAFGGTLSGDDIARLVVRLRELCKCRGPLWSRDGMK